MRQKGIATASELTPRVSFDFSNKEEGLALEDLPKEEDWPEFPRATDYGKQRCRAKNPTNVYYCTLARGHSGHHIAHGSEVILASWLPTSDWPEHMIQRTENDA